MTFNIIWQEDNSTHNSIFIPAKIGELITKGAWIEEVVASEEQTLPNPDYDPDDENSEETITQNVEVIKLINHPNEYNTVDETPEDCLVRLSNMNGLPFDLEDINYFIYEGDLPNHFTADFVNNTIIEIDQVITREMVNKERFIKTEELGFEFDGKHYQSRPEDLLNISGMTSLANSALLISSTQPTNDLSGNLQWHGESTNFTYPTEDNEMIEMDVFKVLQFSSKAALHKKKMIDKARILKDTTPIPLNYKDKSHWI